MAAKMTFRVYLTSDSPASHPTVACCLQAVKETGVKVALFHLTGSKIVNEHLCSSGEWIRQMILFDAPEESQGNESASASNHISLSIFDMSATIDPWERSTDMPTLLWIWFCTNSHTHWNKTCCFVFHFLFVIGETVPKAVENYLYGKQHMDTGNKKQQPWWCVLWEGQSNTDFINPQRGIHLSGSSYHLQKN